MVLCVGVRILTGWGLRLPSSPPITAQSSVAGTKDYALIDAYGGCIPYLDEIAYMPGGPFSDDGSSIPIECVAGCQRHLTTCCSYQFEDF